MSDEEGVALTPGDDQSLLGLILKTTREFYGTQGEAYLRRQLAAAHAEGAAAEREACAQIAAEWRLTAGEGGRIAAAIRARAREGRHR
jgi:hypothetical protein